MTRHQLMDPAFPDLVADAAAAEAGPLQKGCHWPRPHEASAAEMPALLAWALGLLARLW
jgi:hypothetical protein